MFRRAQIILSALVLCVVAIYGEAGWVPCPIDVSSTYASVIATPSKTAVEPARQPGSNSGHSSQSPLPTPQLVWLRLKLPLMPPPRVGFSMTEDPTNQTALLFGGFTSNGDNLNDLWSTDGHEWTQINTAFKPIERSGASLVYDESRHEVVLFGGVHDFEFFGSTWKITPNESDWIQMVPETSPPPRACASMADDAARDKIILFGGETVPSGIYLNNLNDTWTWDGMNWQQQFPATLPPPRSGSNMVYDRLRQNIVLFGGASVAALFDDTWIWDGMNWIKQHPLHIPPRRADYGMAYDEVRQEVIVFGGQAGGDLETWTQTWAWDGQDWTQLQTFITPPVEMAYGAQLVYLPRLHSVVLFNDNKQKICSNNECTFPEESEMWALTYQYLSYFPMINK